MLLPVVIAAAVRLTVPGEQTGAGLVIFKVGNALTVTTTGAAVLEHPFASVMLTLKVPELVIFEIVLVVAPLLHK